MLTPAEIIPFFMHESARVREHARRYFYHSGDIGPLTADHCWDALDHTGADETSQWASMMDDTPQTQESLQRTLQALRDGPTENFDYHLQHAIGQLDCRCWRRIAMRCWGASRSFRTSAIICASACSSRSSRSSRCGTV